MYQTAQNDTFRTKCIKVHDLHDLAVSVVVYGAVFVIELQFVGSILTPHLLLLLLRLEVSTSAGVSLISTS